MVARNPVTGIKTPPIVPGTRRFLTADQVEDLAAAMRSPYDLLVRVLAYSGIRFGEAAALRRSRCDLDRSQPHIIESVAEVAGQLHFGSTKTNRQRVVALPTTVRDRLKDHLDRIGPEAGTLLFTSPKGRPLRYSNFRRRLWVPAMVKAGLDELEIHELRYTAASLMISQGADPKLVQSQLGHSSISITYDIYGHLFPDRLDDLAARLDELIQRDKPSRTRGRDIGRSL